VLRRIHTHLSTLLLVVAGFATATAVASPTPSRCKPHWCVHTTPFTTATNTTVGTTTTTVASTTTTTTVSPPPIGRFGVDDGGNLETLSSTDLTQYLDAVKASGATWLRVGLYWCTVMQGGPTSYNWAPFDRIVDLARLRGLNILGVLIYTPAWARPSGTNASYPPTDLNDYASYVHAAAAHFAPHGVHTYEIWNEPNLAGFWAPAPDAARYTQLLRLAYPAIKSSDPTATVLTGGLSPGGTPGTITSTYTNPVTFLEQMYKDGAHRYFDAVGWHPYSYPYGLGFYTWSAWSQMSQTSPSARSVMAAYGDSGKQIWPTEMGAPTGTSSQAVTEAAQAQLVTEMYSKLKGWSWAGPGFVYNFRDKGTDPSDREDNFGIVRWDYSPKPAYTAFKTAASAG
jgi:polysaccharide biosynthesis protein PslG